MKNMTMIDQFTSCGSSVTNAVRLSAGVQWGEVYQWLEGKSIGFHQSFRVPPPNSLKFSEFVQLFSLIILV